MKYLMIAASSIALLAGTAHATTIIETTDFANGNINGDTLLAGVLSDNNDFTITGSISTTCRALRGQDATCDFWDGDFADVLRINLGNNPPYSVAAQFTISNFVSSLSQVSPARTVVALAAPGSVSKFLDFSGNGTFNLNLDNSNTFVRPDVLVLAPDFRNSGIINQGLGSVSFDYSISLQATSSAPVSPVPLPASMPLLIGGIAALGWAAKRKKALEQGQTCRGEDPSRAR